MYSRADFGVGVVLVGIGVLLIGAARRLPKGDDPLGPGFLPTVIGAALIGLALFLVVQVLRAVPRGEWGLADEFNRAGIARVAAASVTMIGLVLSLSYLPWIGFPVLSTFAVLVLALLYGGRIGVATLGFSALLSLAVYVLFRIWFKLPLPGPSWI